MSFFSALRRKPEEEDLYEDYEESYAYEDEGQDWASEGVQPIHSVADMQIVLVAPQEYKDASKIADLLRDMKFVVLNLAKTERDVARRLLDFVSGVIYTEDGHIMKVATNVYVVAPYFVDLLGAPARATSFIFNGKRAKHRCTAAPCTCVFSYFHPVSSFSSVSLHQHVFQCLRVQNSNRPPPQGNNAPAGKLVEHPGHHLPGGTDIPGNLLMGRGKGGRLSPLALLQQKGRQSLFQAEKYNLLHGPAAPRNTESPPAYRPAVPHPGCCSSAVRASVRAGLQSQNSPLR